jgi:hypothetical protein
MRLSFASLFLPALIVALPAVAAQSPRNLNTLELGTAVTGTLSQGQSQRFSVKLEQGQFVHLVVNQRGIDVIVRVSADSQPFVGEFDSGNDADGPENVKFAALVPGTYFFDISPFNQIDEGSGRFEARLMEIRSATETELRAARAPEARKAKGIELLSTMAAMLPEIRSIPSRVRAQVRAAHLLWPVDEKLARKLAADATTSVGEYIEKGNTRETDAYQFYNSTTQLRDEVLRFLSERDPEVALSFLRSTRAANTDASTGNDEAQELRLEATIASQLAGKDPRRAYEIAADTLNRGYASQLQNVISGIRQSQPVLAARLAGAAASKLQDEKLLSSQEAANLAIGLLNVHRNTAPRGQGPDRGSLSTPPVLTPIEHRNLLTAVLSQVLAFEFPPYGQYSPEGNVARNLLNTLKNMTEDVRSLAPGSIQALEEKAAGMNTSNPRDRWYQDINNSPIDTALASIALAPSDLRDSLYQQLANRIAGMGDIPKARDTASRVANPGTRQVALDAVERQTVQAALNKNRIDEALQRVVHLRVRRDRLNMIGQIVNRLNYGQKAASVPGWLEQAHQMLGVSPRAEDQEQMNALIQIATVFQKYDPRRGFEIIEPLIDQFNDLSNAARTLNGFGQQYYQDGELNLHFGNGLGNVATQLTGALGQLAQADFDRAKSDAERLQRPEMRLAAFLSMAEHAINMPGARQILRH